ncbi:MAG: hypothetical protein ABSF28_23370 [Terracidiphilus sp.]|jgi:hypothetical protein
MSIFEWRTWSRSAKVAGKGPSVSAEGFHGLPTGFALSWISLLVPAPVRGCWLANISLTTEVPQDSQFEFTVKHQLQESSGVCILLTDQISAILSIDSP